MKRKKILSGLLVFAMLLEISIVPVGAEEGSRILDEPQPYMENKVEEPQPYMEDMAEEPEVSDSQEEEIQAYAAPASICKPEEWEVLSYVNDVRISSGSKPLSMMGNLQNASNVRAVELVDLFSHTRPDGSECLTAMDEQGVNYQAAGENIAAGQRDAGAVMGAWMNSPGHRGNILSDSFSHIGVGYHLGGGTYGKYWVQMFTGDCSPRSIAIMGDSGAAYPIQQGKTLNGLGLTLQVACGHGTAYMPVREQMCSSYDCPGCGRSRPLP